MKREFIKCSEVEREYGISKYFIKKAGVKGVKISDSKCAPLYYSVKDIESAIAKWNGTLAGTLAKKQSPPLPTNAPDWKSKAAGDTDNV